MSAQSHSDEGFTLVELLVTLALLSLMLVYSTSAFSTLREIDRVSADAAAQEEVDAAARYLRAALADARVSFRPDGNGRPQLLFEGRQDRILFVGAEAGEGETGGLYAVSVDVDQEGRLVTYHDLLRATPPKRQTPIVLLSGVMALELAYGGEPTGDGELEFAESWPFPDRLPLAVRITVRFADGDRRAWPESLVAIKASQ